MIPFCQLLVFKFIHRQKTNIASVWCGRVFPPLVCRILCPNWGGRLAGGPGPGGGAAGRHTSPSLKYHQGLGVAQLFFTKSITLQFASPSESPVDLYKTRGVVKRKSNARLCAGGRAADGRPAPGTRPWHPPLLASVNTLNPSSSVFTALTIH